MTLQEAKDLYPYACKFYEKGIGSQEMREITMVYYPRVAPSYLLQMCVVIFKILADNYMEEEQRRKK